MRRPGATGLGAALLCCALGSATMAAPAASAPATPDFSGLWSHGPVDAFKPVPGKPAATQYRDPNPDLANFFALKIEGDWRNPNLRPWAAAVVKRHSEAAAAGHGIPTPQETCFPSGVPNIATVPAAIQFLQTADKVTILYMRDHQVRQVHLNVPHSKTLTPTWYGESVGRYEGDTLVVDTIGLNDKTPVDFFGTPHTEDIHVVERYRLINDGRNLELTVTVTDPKTFIAPWSGVMTHNRVRGKMGEEACAENNREVSVGEHYPVPVQE